MQGFARVLCSYWCNDPQGAAVAVHGTDDELVAHCLQGRGEAQRAIDSLPEEYRDVVVLRFMDDLTYDEIARHLGVPVSTIETRLHRAKKQLRRLLRELLV